MPDIDFNYSGLGEAYRVFSQKWARLLSVRDYLEDRLASHVRRAEEDLEVQRTTQATVLSGSHGYAAAGAVDLLHIYDQHRQWQSRVLRTVREMELAYLVAMADAFVGRWRQENGLPTGTDPGDRWWFAAREKHN
jgi:hypothetical protein